LSAPITESVVEEAALEWFEALNYKVLPGPSIAPGEPAAERTAYSDVVLDERLRAALKRLNPSASPEALDEAFRKLTRIASPQPIDSNHELHYYLVNGVSVEYLRPDGTVGYDPVRVLDFDEPANNDWLAVNQFTVAEKGHTRRPGHRDLLVWSATGVSRAEKRLVGKHDHLECVPPDPDIQERVAWTVRIQ
jgi:type I restriction enzyme R subunit